MRSKTSFQDVLISDVHFSFLCDAHFRQFVRFKIYFKDLNYSVSLFSIVLSTALGDFSSKTLPRISTLKMYMTHFKTLHKIAFIKSFSALLKNGAKDKF